MCSSDLHCPRDAGTFEARDDALDNGNVADRQQRLGNAERERPQPRTETPDEDDGVHADYPWVVVVTAEVVLVAAVVVVSPATVVPVAPATVVVVSPATVVVV